MYAFPYIALVFHSPTAYFISDAFHPLKRFHVSLYLPSLAAQPTQPEPGTHICVIGGSQGNALFPQGIFEPDV